MSIPVARFLSNLPCRSEHRGSLGTYPAPPLGITLLCALLCALLSASLAPEAEAVWENGDWAMVFEPVDDALDVETCADGQGGMIVATVDQDAGAQKIALSRIDHTGNEIWGNGGIYLPFDMSSDWQNGPMDVAPDGNGGAFCAFREGYGAQHIVSLAHVRPNGTVEWKVPVGDYRDTGSGPAYDCMIEATGDGDVIVVWTRDDYDLNEDERLRAARVSAAGGVVWETDINLEMDLFSNPEPSYWDVCSDGVGGVLVSWSVVPYMQAIEMRAQRVAGNGVVMWGANGHMIWTAFGGIPQVVGDGGGGAYVIITTGYGEAWAQHMDQFGNETWVVGGLLVQNAATWPNPCNPAVCEDGLGGFFLVQGVEDLYVQHVDIWGNQLWGGNGFAITALAGWQDYPTIAHDGFGGAIIVYRDHYFSDAGDPNNQVLSGARIDLFGTVLWSESVLWWSDWQDGLEPWSPQIVADASGGALVTWSEFNYARTTNDVRAMGVSPTGSVPAEPTLTYLFPESGSPGDVLPVTIFGDYLENGQTFHLEHHGGGPAISITGATAASYTQMNGTLDLAGAAMGAYDLVVNVGGSPRATLDSSFGVGEPPVCEGDDLLPAGGGTPILDQSPRTAAYDSSGDLHVVWIEWASPAYYLYYAKGGPTGWTVPPVALYSVNNPWSIAEPCLAIGPDDVVHIVVTEFIGTHTRLAYRREDPGGTIVDYLDNGMNMSSPTMTVDVAGNAHIVFAQDAGGGITDLRHAAHDGYSFYIVVDLAAGTNARLPDLTETGTNQMMLTFVRDSWFPGLSEVCYLRYDGGAWGQPVMMYFGGYADSPSVAWDGGSKVLFSFILGADHATRLLHTALMDSWQLGPVRWHLTDHLLDKCAVGGAGPDLFYLLAEESNYEVTLREGDGNVFYPKRIMNTAGNTHRPGFAVERDGDGLFAMWENWDLPGYPILFWDCYGDGTGIAGGTAPPVAAGALAATPNPFNPTTTLTFSLADAGWARLVVYDVRGRVVRTLVDGRREAGAHDAVWDGRDDHGVALASGVYFSRLILPGGAKDDVAKLTLLK